MEITLLVVGKLKEAYWQEAYQHFLTQLSKSCVFHMVERKDEKTDDQNSAAQDQLIKEREGLQLLSQLAPKTYVVALDPDGLQLTTAGFRKKMQELEWDGIKNITFIIGGSLGLSDQVLARADLKLSFSAMTFPHQLMRILFMEQLLAILSPSLE